MNTLRSGDTLHFQGSRQGMWVEITPMSEMTCVCAYHVCRCAHKELPRRPMPLSGVCSHMLSWLVLKPVGADGSWILWAPIMGSNLFSFSESFQWHAFPFGHFTILEFPLSLKGEPTVLVFYCVIRLSGWHLPSWWASRTSGMICSLGTLLGVFSVLRRMLEGCWQPLNVFCCASSDVQ